jgi:hypothetical protein
MMFYHDVLVTIHRSLCERYKGTLVFVHPIGGFSQEVQQPTLFDNHHEMSIYHEI